MRRWIATTACAAALLLSAACSNSPAPGTDGDVTDEWSAIEAPAGFKPAARTCHGSTSSGSLEAYRPIDCKQPHVSETAFVGTHTAAGGAELPEDGSPGAKAAYRQCSQRASAFVGGPWRTGRISVAVVWPTPQAWAGGARWYRCDLAQADLTTSEPVTRRGSMAKSLTGAAPLKLRCFNPKIDKLRVSRMDPVPCTAKHRAEFVGVWQAPDMALAKLDADQNRIAKGCRTAIASYAGVPDDSNVQYRSGWISYNPTAEQWELGERAVQCFMWFDDRQMTRSHKGAGTSGLPIRYA